MQRYTARFIILGGIIMLLLAGAPTGAQDDDSTCPAIVQEALGNIVDLCADTSRNQACYGNLTLVAEPQFGVDDLQFGRPGDIEDVVRIASLTLNQLDEERGEWGVAMMRLQANLPETLPGQNVTMLLFGDVQLTSAVDPEDEEAASPMQAFYFRSGVGDSACAEAPESGIIIRTPKDAGMVSLTVNGVDIALGSTAFLQARPEDFLHLYLLEGEASVTALEQAQTVSPGQVVTVPLDDTLAPAGPPADPGPFEIDTRPLETMIAVAQPGTTVDPVPESTETATEEGTEDIPSPMIFNMANCGKESVTAGQQVHFMQGVDCLPKQADALAIMRGSYPISIDGRPLPTYLTVAYESCHLGRIGFNVNAHAHWVAVEGDHTFSSFNIAGPFSCSFTVTP